jgi:hypothetical protein
MKPLPNNGTLRLPLRPIGLHNDEDAPALDSPEDPPASTTVRPVRPDPLPSAPPSPPSSSPSPSPSPGSPDSADSPDSPDSGADNPESKPSSWWTEMKESLESFKEWVSEVFQAKQDNRPPS